MMQRSIIPAVLLFAFIMPLRAAEPESDARIAMTNINSAFIAAHGAARKNDLAKGGPVVMYRGGKLVLLDDGEETSVQVVPEVYHTYKTFAHMPPAIFLMLRPMGLGELDDDRLKQLQAYRTKMKLLEEKMDRIGLAGSALERQKKILAASGEFLDKVIKTKQVAEDELTAYTRSMAPAIKANLFGAAKAQIDGMHGQMMRWKKQWPAEKWAKLRIAVKGAVFARDRNTAKQYFQRLLRLPGEGPRLAYVELYYEPTPMETLVATWAVDGELAVAFFDEPTRMYRDALGDAATAYLRTMQF